jgi:hypothetical protein
MSETGRIIILLAVLIIVYILTRKYHVWRIKRTYVFILRDLESKGALDEQTAVDLPYAKASLIGMGTRDYRPKALEYLVAANMVEMTESGKYYLRQQRAAPDKGA